ncbi:MAG TPA: hypothetical protein VG734_01745 [Lacunisphaera sp.]|nr:hypothetical protein [Lacunisphaera sp.]
MAGTKGDKGDAGPSGPQGPAGTGLTRLNIYKVEALVATGTAAAANCLNTKDILLSGGCSSTAAIRGSYPTYHEDSPAGGLDSWGCSTTTSGQIYVVAYCVRMP